MPDGMHRQLRHFLTLLLHHQRLPLLMQVAALGGDVERVLQFTHGETSLGFERSFRVWLELIKIRHLHLFANNQKDQFHYWE